jgi:hypothetical protein
VDFVVFSGGSSCDAESNFMCLVAAAWFSATGTCNPVVDFVFITDVLCVSLDGRYDVLSSQLTL